MLTSNEWSQTSVSKHTTHTNTPNHALITCSEPSLHKRNPVSGSGQLEVGAGQCWAFRHELHGQGRRLARARGQAKFALQFTRTTEICYRRRKFPRQPILHGVPEKQTVSKTFSDAFSHYIVQLASLLQNNTVAEYWSLAVQPYRGKPHKTERWVRLVCCRPYVKGLGKRV